MGGDLRQLLVTLRREDGVNVRIRAPQAVAIASSAVHGAEGKKHAFCVSNPSVARCVSALAMNMLLLQEILMIVTIRNLTPTSPSWAMAVPMFDETSEVLPLQIFGRRIVSSLHCFVLCICFSWGFDGSDEVYTFKANVPPIPCANTSAPALWDALRMHPWTKAIWSFKCRLFELAALALQLSTTDSASGNDKLHAFETSFFPNVMMSSLPCMNHQNNLGRMDVILATIGQAPLTSMYWLAKFKNMGTHRLRCMITANRHVRSVISFSIGVQSEADASFATEAVAFIRRWEVDHNEDNEDNQTNITPNTIQTTSKSNQT